MTYMGFCIYGWTYVNLITLKRADPFTSGRGGYKDIGILLMTAPILFLASGIIVLRSRHDLAGYCTNENQANEFSEQVKLMLSSVTNEDNSSDTLGCHVYTDDQIFSWNFSYWTTGFVLFGINFSHIDVGPMQYFSLSLEAMKSWGAFLWTVFAALLIVLCMII